MAVVHPDKVRTVVERAPTPEEIGQLTAIFKVLGDPTRARLLYAMLEAGELWFESAVPRTKGQPMSETVEPSGQIGFDRAHAVTRSLLGYGVLAGVFYVVVGLVQALLRDGFDLSRHSLSLLANGSWGWVQTLNFVVSGLMVLVAAVGIARAMRPARAAAALVGVFGASLIAAGAFPADPMDGFPPGTPLGAPEDISTAGVVHLAAGGIGLAALAAAFAVLGGWFARRQDARLATGSRIAAAVVLVAFIAGAATATSTAGIALLWVAVLTGWGWLALASLALYRTVPHPDADRRTPGP